MGFRPFQFTDVPANFKLTLHDMTTGVVTDSAGKLYSIDNSFGNGVNPALTANAAKRHTISALGGQPTAFSSDTNLDGILISDPSAFPKGNEDRYMMVIQYSQDGIVFGYRGDTPGIDCVDNPYPGYRNYMGGVSTLTGKTTPSANKLHTLELVHANSRRSMYVDAVLDGAQDCVLNTIIKQVGVKGAQTNYYTMKGHWHLAMFGKGAPSADLQARIQWRAAQRTGIPLPAGHAYANTTPVVDDGVRNSIYVGAAGQAARYVGSRAVSELYLGAATLF